MNMLAARQDALRYEEIVAKGGMSDTHRAVISWVPQRSRVLELGCATGYLGEILVRDRGCRVDAVELDPIAAERAASKGLKVTVGSLDDPAVTAAIPGPYDVVIATDVIEHLRDPSHILTDLGRWIGRSGVAIVAVPNVAVWSMRLRLLRGDFEYADSGLLDRTHLRFFTWHTLHAT